MHRLLGFRHIVEFEKTFPEAGPGKPFVRILPGRLFQNGDRFITSAFLIEVQRGLHPRPRQTQANRLVAGCDFMGHREYSQIVLPCAFLLNRKYAESDGGQPRCQQ